VAGTKSATTVTVAVSDEAHCDILSPARNSQTFPDLGPHAFLFIDWLATGLQTRHNLIKPHENLLKMVVT